MTEHKYEYHLIDEIDEHDVTEELITEREQDINSITRDIFDINEIFKTLNTVVQEQGYLLDNIEDNIEHVVINVENAEIELESAKKKQEKTGLWLWWLFWILLVIVIIVIIVVLNVK
jgi:t-SNARE complex subunit (syntaxin)